MIIAGTGDAVRIWRAPHERVQTLLRILARGARPGDATLALLRESARSNADVSTGPERKRRALPGACLDPAA